jgi:hypothetical protein
VACNEQWHEFLPPNATTHDSESEQKWDSGDSGLELLLFMLPFILLFICLILGLFLRWWKARQTQQLAPFPPEAALLKGAKQIQPAQTKMMKAGGAVKAWSSGLDEGAVGAQISLPFEPLIVLLSSKCYRHFDFDLDSETQATAFCVPLVLSAKAARAALYAQRSSRARSARRSPDEVWNQFRGHGQKHRQ